MKWYVRYKGIGEISGPMAELDARDMADRADGVAFSELIFQIDTAREVEQVLADLRQDIRDIISENKSAVPPEASTCQVKNCLRDLHDLTNRAEAPKETIRNIAHAAIRIIEGLSGTIQDQPTEVDVEVAELLVALNKVLCGELREKTERLILELAHPKYILSGEVGLLITELRSGMQRALEYSDPIFGLLQRVIEAIVQLSREKVISGTIHGGVLTLDELPEGVRVDIRDYDTEGLDKTKRDEQGEYFSAG